MATDRMSQKLRALFIGGPAHGQVWDIDGWTDPMIVPGSPQMFYHLRPIYDQRNEQQENHFVYVAEGTNDEFLFDRLRPVLVQLGRLPLEEFGPNRLPLAWRLTEAYLAFDRRLAAVSLQHSMDRLEQVKKRIGDEHCKGKG